ncbi:MAG: protein kinase [Gemmataceae bacterium]
MDEPEDYLHQVNSEPIPGYRLLTPLGRGGFGEVWKCEAPGGLHKAIKFVHGGLHALDDRGPAEEELRAIQRVKSIRHPFLLSMERVERVGNELVIVLELADQSLSDVYRAERAAGRPGIERQRLLAYLREAAEALDVLNKQHGLQHLDVKPQNLFLVSNHVKVGDFGLVSSLSTSGNLGLGAITPLYASPEVFQGKISAHSDQYSLAIVYMELLTGHLPFQGKNSRMLMLQHVQQLPDLSALPESDRAAIAQALAKQPEQRFASCSDLVEALASGVTDLTLISGIDTRTGHMPRTVRAKPAEAPRPSVPRCSAGPLEVQERISRSPLAEVWRATLPTGEERQVWILFGCAGPGEARLDRLNHLKHDHLLPIEILQHQPGRLLLVQTPGQRNLRDWMQAYQARGLAGVPRRELLHCLRIVAQTLDHLASKYEVRHLGLNPRVVVWQGDQIRIAQMGLAQLVWLPAQQNIAQLNARYSAPELFHRQVSETCDQYSLALIFYEMLTGSFPTPGQPSRRGELRVPLLDRVSAEDRMVLTRALNPDPTRRWQNCLELIRALEQNTSATDPNPEVALTPASAPLTQPMLVPPTQTRFPEALVVPEMQMRLVTSLSAEQILERLEGFREQWDAVELAREARAVSLRLAAPESFWGRGHPELRPILELEVTIGWPEVQTPAGVQTRTEVRLDIRVRDCTLNDGHDLLKRVGPLLAESVRQYLQLGSRGRQQERVPWHHPFQFCPLGVDGNHGVPIDAQGKDLSLNGIGFYIQTPLPSAHVLLLLPQTEQTPKMSIPARVVRVQGFGDGWYEIGAVLLPPDELPEDEVLYSPQA